MVAVISQHSRLRDLFPFYTADQLLFGIVMVLGAYAFFLWLEPSAAPLCTAGSYIGMALVSYSARPAYMIIDEHKVPMLVGALRSIEYRHIADRDHWVPPLPRWLHWKHNFVKINASGIAVRVNGPANALSFLATRLG